MYWHLTMQSNVGQLLHNASSNFSAYIFPPASYRAFFPNHIPYPGSMSTIAGNFLFDIQLILP